MSNRRDCEMDAPESSDDEKNMMMKICGARAGRKFDDCGQAMGKRNEKSKLFCPSLQRVNRETVNSESLDPKRINYFNYLRCPRCCGKRVYFYPKYFLTGGLD